MLRCIKSRHISLHKLAHINRDYVKKLEKRRFSPLKITSSYGDKTRTSTKKLTVWSHSFITKIILYTEASTKFGEIEK